MAANNTDASKFITPEGTLSYPSIFKTDKNGKFGATLVFPAGTDLTPFKKAIFAALAKKHGEPKAKEMMRGKHGYRLEGGPHHSIRNDGEEKYGAGTVFINARGNQPPGVVSIYKDPKTGKPMPVTDESKVYAGVKVVASVSAYWYEKDGNKGVAWGLNNIQIRGDGPRLDNRRSAEDEFEATEEATADLSDVSGADESEDEGAATEAWLKG